MVLRSIAVSLGLFAILLAASCDDGTQNELSSSSSSGSGMTTTSSSGAASSSSSSSGDMDGGDADAAATVNVRGHVAFQTYGDSVAGASVVVGNRTVTTDITGAFAIDGVATPYNIRVNYTNERATTYIVEGVTRADPTIELGEHPVGQVRNATLTGNVAGITFPLPATTRVQVLMTSGAGATIFATLPVSAATGAFSIAPSWRGGATRTAKAYAVVFTVDGAGDATAITGFGSITALLTDTQTTNGGALSVTLPATGGTATMNLTLPASLINRLANTGIQFEPGINFEADRPGMMPYSIPFNAFTGATPYASISGNLSSGGSSRAYKTPLVNGETFSVDTGTPLAITTPADAAVFSPTVPFEWGTRTSGPFVFRAFDASAHIVFMLVTRRSSVLWPSDVALAPGTYTWTVMHQSSLASIDAHLGPRGLSGLHSRVFAPSRTFTVN